MNFLLAVAFLVTFSSMLKDLNDSKWNWENKILFSLIPSILSIIPLILNFIVFVKSDKNKWKLIKHNFLQFVLGDLFHDVMVKRNMLNKGIFCNQAVLGNCSFYGGDCMFLNPNDHTNWGKFFTSNHIFYFLKKFHMRHVITVDRSTPVVYKYEEVRNFSDLKKKFIEIMNLNHGEVSSFTKISMRLMNDRIEVRYINEIESAQTVIHQTSDPIMIAALFNLFFIFDFSIDDSWLHNLKIDFSVGCQHFRLFDQRIKSLINGSEINDHGQVANARRFFVLVYTLSFWEVNPNKGVMKSGTPKMRGKTKIYHCFSLDELIGYVNNDMCIWSACIGVEECYLEGETVKLFAEELIDETVKKAIGAVNAATLRAIINTYTENQEAVGILLMKLIDFCGQRNITCNVRGLVGNSAIKKLLVDSNYFLSMINYRCIKGIDKNVRVSKTAVRLGMVHSKLVADEKVIKSMPEIFNSLKDTVKPKVLKSCHYIQNREGVPEKCKPKTIGFLKKKACCNKLPGFERELKMCEKIKEEKVEQLKKSFLEVLTEVKPKSFLDTAAAVNLYKTLEMKKVCEKTQKNDNSERKRKCKNKADDGKDWFDTKKYKNKSNFVHSLRVIHTKKRTRERMNIKSFYSGVEGPSTDNKKLEDILSKNTFYLLTKLVNEDDLKFDVCGKKLEITNPLKAKFDNEKDLIHAESWKSQVFNKKIEMFNKKERLLEEKRKIIEEEENIRKKRRAEILLFQQENERRIIEAEEREKKLKERIALKILIDSKDAPMPEYTAENFPFTCYEDTPKVLIDSIFKAKAPEDAKFKLLSNESFYKVLIQFFLKPELLKDKKIKKESMKGQPEKESILFQLFSSN